MHHRLVGAGSASGGSAVDGSVFGGGAVGGSAGDSNAGFWVTLDEAKLKWKQRWEKVG